MVSVKTFLRQMVVLALTGIPVAWADTDMATEPIDETQALAPAEQSSCLDIRHNGSSSRDLSVQTFGAKGVRLLSGSWAVVPRDLDLFEQARRARQSERARRTWSRRRLAQ